MKVTIVDYGAGNLRSIRNAIYMSGGQHVVGNTVESILNAERIVLPGVGAASNALNKLRNNKLDEALEEAVLKKGTPMLGICLGMQMLAKKLFEFGESDGLGWIEGNVISIHDLLPNKNKTVPHTGWSSIDVNHKNGSIIPCNSKSKYYYFCHSYTLSDYDPNIVEASFGYGKKLVAAIKFNNVFATQFHPEKSQLQGMKLFKNFLSWNP